MVSFGLIEEWQPRPGRLISLVASPTAVRDARRAPVHPVPPSHQQEEYLLAAQRNSSAGFRFSRLCLMAFDVPAPLDIEALRAAVTGFLRRHDTFRSWFAIDDDGAVDRHLVDAECIDLIDLDHGVFTSPAAIRAHVQAETPGPFDWNCFTFGAIEFDGGFTLYGAVDHLNTDGISQALMCGELMTLYLAEAFGTPKTLAPVGSYLEYCARERELSSRLNRNSPHVERWIDLLRANGGRLPSFPLPLGKDTATYNRSAHFTTTIFDESAADRFEDVCRAAGTNMTAGLLAVAALAYAEFSGESGYLGMTPKSTRNSGSERGAVGWFTSLIPVPVTVDATTTFTAAAADAGRGYLAGKELTDASFHRVAQLIRPEDGIEVTPGWSVPMISYIDVRKLPGVELFAGNNGCLYGNRGTSEEVFTWVNRFADRTMMTFLYPGTDVGHEPVGRYAERLTEIMNVVAAEGEYVPALPALT